MSVVRGGTIDNIKFPRSNTESTRDIIGSRPEVYRISRGGEVTWHGPGQLVAYPLLNLAHPWHKKDLRWYVHQLEETVIQTLAKVGILGERSCVNPGVWVGRRKIAAIGISASRWITMHGIALNISCDLSMYETIIPCGILPAQGGVTSINEELSRRRSLSLSLAQENDTGCSGSMLDPALALEGGTEMEVISGHFRSAFSEVFNVEYECISDSRDDDSSDRGDDKGKSRRYSLETLLNSSSQNSVDRDVLLPLEY